MKYMKLTLLLMVVALLGFSLLATRVAGVEQPLSDSEMVAATNTVPVPPEPGVPRVFAPIIFQQQPPTPMPTATATSTGTVTPMPTHTVPATPPDLSTPTVTVTPAPSNTPATPP